MRKLQESNSNVLTNKLPCVYSLMHLKNVAVFYSTQLHQRTSNKMEEKLIVAVNISQILCDRATGTTIRKTLHGSTSHEKLTTWSCISSEQREEITVQSENLKDTLNTNMHALL